RANAAIFSIACSRNPAWNAQDDCGSSVAAMGRTSGRKTIRVVNAAKKAPTLASTRSSALRTDGHCEAMIISLRRTSPLKRFDESEHVIDLIGIEPELRHGRMGGADPFGEASGQAVDRKLEVQIAERRGDLERAFAGDIDRMALRAVHAHER